MGIAQRYQEVVFEETQLLAVYPPMVRVTPGMVGRLFDGRFVPETSLAELGPKLGGPIPFDVVTGTSTMSRELKSEDVSRWLIAAGATGPTGVISAKAQLKLRFESNFSVYANVAGARIKRIKNITALGDELLRRNNLDPIRWDADLKVVTAVMEVERATIIISSKKETEIVLEAEGDVPMINLADASLKFSVVFDNTTSDQYISQSGNLTPFCQLHQVDPDWPSEDDWEVVEPSMLESMAAPPAAHPRKFLPHDPRGQSGRLKLHGWRIDS